MLVIIIISRYYLQYKRVHFMHENIILYYIILYENIYLSVNKECVIRNQNDILYSYLLKWSGTKFWGLKESKDEW